jgi:hypothetical protein
MGEKQIPNAPTSQYSAADDQARQLPLVVSSFFLRLVGGTQSIP